MAEAMRVACYARVSTEHEAQMYALENQEDWYKGQLAMHPEWQLVEMYVDKGITGTSAEKRPSFLRMIEDAKKGKFKLIITREVSRFARNIVDAINYTRELKKYDVGVLFITDGINTLDPDGEFRLSLFATFAQDESRKMSVRVRAGMRTSMEKGVPLGNGNILGYDKVNGEYIINKEQAKTVRQIYDWALEGYGLRAIKTKLENGGFKTAMGKDNWYESVISHILDNKFYYGMVEYQKYFVDDFLEQKQQKNHGEIEKIYVWGKHETIVTEEEFNKVQEIRAERRKRKQEEELESKRIYGVKPKKDCWTKLLVCGDCDKPFTRNKWHKYPKTGRIAYAYQCTTLKNAGTVKTRLKRGLNVDGICKTPYIPDWQLQLMTKHVLLNCSKSFDEIINIAEKIVLATVKADEEERNGLKNQISEMNLKIEKLIARKDKVMDLLLDELITKDEYKKKVLDFDHQILDLQAKINKAEGNLEQSLTNDDGTQVINNLKAQLKNMRDLISVDILPDSVVEAFIEKIIVYEDHFVFKLKYDDDVPVKKEGKTKKTFKIINLFPPLDSSITGYNQQFEETVKVAEFTLGKAEIQKFQSTTYGKELRRKADISLNVVVTL